MADFLANEDDAGDSEPDNLWVACTNGDIGRLQELLSQSMTINQQDEYGFSPLHAAVSYSQVELLRYVLEQGGDVNIRDAEGDTPLLVCESPEVFEILVAAGADPNAVNSDGEGILQKVVEDENEEMVLYLVEKGFAPPGFKFEFKEQDFEEWNGEENEEENEETGDSNAMERE